MNFKNPYKPNKEFRDRTKHTFLSEFHKKFPAGGPVPLYAFRYFIRGLATGVAIMILLGAGATYADQKNVGPNNILYPLKRTQETIKLALTKEENKPAAHLKLAERRIEEIRAVRKENPESPKIEKLTQDLQKEVAISFKTLEVIKIETSTETITPAPSKPEKVQIPLLEKTQESAPSEATSLPQEPEKPTTPKPEITTPDLKIEKPAQAVSPPKLVIRKEDFLTCESWRKILGFEEIEGVEIFQGVPEVLEEFYKKCQGFYEISIPEAFQAIPIELQKPGE